jgi:hypothetical protein
MTLARVGPAQESELLRNYRNWCGMLKVFFAKCKKKENTCLPTAFFGGGAGGGEGRGAVT